jgi:acetate---CoA ligase (ADP-forming)
MKAEIEDRIGFVSGDGNPLDAWGNGTFVANLPLALELFDRSPDHDIVVFCRDNCEGQPFEMPELPRSYLELLVRAAASSKKPHYLLHTRPGVMNREQVAYLRAAGIPVVGGIREGLAAIDRLARYAEPQGDN